MGVSNNNASIVENYLVDMDTGVSINLSSYIPDVNEMDAITLSGILPLYYDLLDQMVLWTKKEELLSSLFEKVEPLDFYRMLFPIGSFERRGHMEDGKPNGIAVAINKGKDGKQHSNSILITDELEAIERLQGSCFAFMSPIGYIGRSRHAKNARYIYALTFDIDGVSDMDRMNDVIYQQHESKFAPKPTFTVNSGTGLHLYYQFEEPLPAYPNILEALKNLKYTMLPLVWNRYVSTEKKTQKQGVVQGFRIVGTQSKLGSDYPVTAYKTGEKITLDYLMSFLGETTAKQCRSAFQPLKAETPLEEAKEKWPDWYNRVILKQGERQTWHVKRDLYDWWLRLCKNESSGVAVGHRYFCCMALAIFARKCDIEESELISDAMDLVPIFDSLSKTTQETFTEDDALRALDAYTDSYSTFPRKDIEALTGIDMPVNKRNYRKQKNHLKIARYARDVNQQEAGTSWWTTGNRNGAPIKKELVQDYAAAHPEANHSQIAKALGISRTTVIKWLKEVSDVE